MEHLSKDLVTLTADTLNHLRQEGYSAATVKTHSTMYSNLHLFCNKNAIYLYTEEIGERYMESKRRQQPVVCKAGLRRYHSAIRRLNSVLTGTNWAPLCKPQIATFCTAFDDVICEYEAYLQQTGKTQKDVRRCVLLTARFLSCAEQMRCTKLSDLSAQHVYAGFQESTSKISFRMKVGAFLRYAHTYNHIAIDLSCIIPSVTKHTAVPSVYSPEEIERLLASLDRTTEVGKRNYAVILLIARTGLRASDISELTFDSLHRNKGTIEIVQRKTKVPLSLPLTDEIIAALDDYINNGRSQFEDEHIFLNLRGYGVLLPANIGAIVHSSFIRSGIERKGRGSGSHCLRASLASALLTEGNDFYTIQRVLGQRCIQSTKSYVKTDVELLRISALPVPLASGDFEVLLEDGGV